MCPHVPNDNHLNTSTIESNLRSSNDQNSQSNFMWQLFRAINVPMNLNLFYALHKISLNLKQRFREQFLNTILYIYHAHKILNDSIITFSKPHKIE